MMTTEQVRTRTKTVTRRIGWKFLKPGDMVRACVRCMGLKAGEKIEELAIIRILSVRREPLDAITRDDVEREGFEGHSPDWFVEMFCLEMGVAFNDIVTRIEFEYV